MKATIDFDDALYRRLKVEAARRGRTVRDLVAEGVRMALDAPPSAVDEPGRGTEWFGALAAYADEADTHDLPAMRASIARGRTRTAQ
jgi:hypothetical protein